MNNLITEIREKLDLTQDELALKLNISRELVNKMENKKAEISHKTKARISELLEKEKVNNISHTASEQINNPDRALSLQAIVNLTKTGIIQAETNKIAVNNSSRLITLLEEKEKNIIAHDDQENPAIGIEVLKPVLVLMAEIGVGKAWKSKEEGLDKIDRLVYGSLKKKQSESNVADVGK